MALQNINYFSLLGNLNVKHFLLRQKINNNPNIISHYYLSNHSLSSLFILYNIIN